MTVILIKRVARGVNSAVDFSGAMTYHDRVMTDRLTVERVTELWAEDSKIDPTELGEESLRIEQVHDKYMKLLARARRQSRDDLAALRRLRLEKTEHYAYGATAETRARGWKTPPQGRLLKKDAEAYVDADPDVVCAARLAGESEDAVEAIEKKLGLIAARGFRISDAIKWHLFTNGAR